MIRGTQEVFRLRREGELDTALALARTLSRLKPCDAWRQRALGWVLVDLCRAQEDEEALRALVSEALTLDVLDRHEDRALLSTIERQRRRLSPQALQEDRAWELRRRLAKAARAWPPRVVRVEALLREYAALELVERPSLVHSLVLAEACRVAPRWPAFAGFARWWSPERCLRPEDHAPFERELPLAIHLARALGRWYLVFGDADPQGDWALDWLLHLAESHPEDEALGGLAARAEAAAILLDPLEPP